jgi:metal-sulfur cluster biosynthetic enzyme
MTSTGSGNPTEQTMPEEINESADVSQSAAVSDDQVKLALRRVKDPELNLNIMDLGLVYGIRVDGSTVNVDMTLTSPACPSGPEIVANVEKELRELEGVEQVQTNIVWTPFWTPEKIEPRVRAYLGL